MGVHDGCEYAKGTTYSNIIELKANLDVFLIFYSPTVDYSEN